MKNMFYKSIAVIGAAGCVGVMLALAGCGKSQPEEAQGAQMQEGGAAASETVNDAEPSESTQEASTDMADAGEAEEKALFTVDITDNLAAEQGIIVGNTSTLNNYSGVIVFTVDDALKEQAGSIEVGKTYIIQAEKMMTMSIPPQTPMVSFAEAADDEIQELEKIRESISNYEQCMENYKQQDADSLDAIIADANFNYATWTQDQIADYIAFIRSNGYNWNEEEKNAVKNYVQMRKDLNGSVAAEEMRQE